MAREIPLTQGKVALVDDADYDRVMQHKWCAIRMKKGGGREYWYAKRGFNQGGKVRSEYLHRFIMQPPAGMLIDHEDGNGLNCQRSNMRPATRAQNQYNQRPRSTQAPYRGVLERRNGWTTQIFFHGVYHRLGTYATAEEAARVFDAAARYFRGEFAQTNFSDIDELIERRVRELLEAEKGRQEQEAA